MPRAKSKSVTIDGLKHNMNEGEIKVYACNDPRLNQRPYPLDYPVKHIAKQDAVLMAVGACTVMLSKQELTAMIYALNGAAIKQWGHDWDNGEVCLG